MPTTGETEAGPSTTKSDGKRRSTRQKPATKGKGSKTFSVEPAAKEKGSTAASVDLTGSDEEEDLPLAKKQKTVSLDK